jgi:hypothetical protein
MACNEFSTQEGTKKHIYNNMNILDKNKKRSHKTESGLPYTKHLEIIKEEKEKKQNYESLSTELKSLATGKG